MPFTQTMGRRIALIQCGKSKRAIRSKAAELYIGSLFVKSLAYARRQNVDAIYILSAKHGVLALEDDVEPYELTLTRMPKTDRAAWSARVIEQLKALTDLEHGKFLVLASVPYRKDLLAALKNSEVPLLGLSQGRQLQFLKNKLA